MTQSANVLELKISWISNIHPLKGDGACQMWLLLILASMIPGGELDAWETGSEVKRDQPNIVLILADDMGYGDPQCFNPKSRLKTPAIDRLAGEGLMFRDAHAPHSTCIASRYGLLTGRYPMRESYRKISHIKRDYRKGWKLS